MKKPVIEFRDFGMRYASQQKPTLYDINLTIYEGEKVLILGPSGSGKSTPAFSSSTVLFVRASCRIACSLASQKSLPL